MVTKQNIFIRFKVSEALKGISNTLQNVELVQLRVDEIVGGGVGSNPFGTKCGSKIAWYKKG